MRIILATILLLAAINAHAGGSNSPASIVSNAPPTSITIDNVIYSNVTWDTVTPATVTIFHSTGVASIPLWKLPPDLQKRFGYDPAKAIDWQKREAAAHAAQQADLAKRQAASKAAADAKAADDAKAEWIRKGGADHVEPGVNNSFLGLDGRIHVIENTENSGSPAKPEAYP